MTITEQSPKIVYRDKRAYLVYQAVTSRHARDGHRRGRWYYRSSLSDGDRPESMPFALREEAEEAAQFGESPSDDAP